MLTLFQRGGLPIVDAEARLDGIAQEEAVLRQQCMALDAQRILAEAVETHLEDAQRLLAQLQDGLLRKTSRWMRCRSQFRSVQILALEFQRTVGIAQNKSPLHSE